MLWPDEKHIELARNFSVNSSSEKCEGCKEIYDEIYSSAFFTEPTEPSILIKQYIIVSIIFIFIFLFCLFYYYRKSKREKNTINSIENSTQTFRQKNSKLDLSANENIVNVS